MTTIAIGDIHGNFSALDDLLDQLWPQLASQDSVVFLGDYIDRGPNSRACIDRIIEFRLSTEADVVTLLGNHEDWLLKTIQDPTRHSWIASMGAFPTIASYSTDAVRVLKAAMEDLGPAMFTDRVKLPYEAFLDELPESHLAFLTELVPFHRIDDVVFAHGGVDPNAGPVEVQDVKALAWGVTDFPEEYDGRDLVVYGHWDNAVVDGEGWPLPRCSHNSVGLDTISHGVLTAMVLPERRVIQSAKHQLGQRSFNQSHCGPRNPDDAR